jgi:leader peptidase (prepilin peptidase) / N-methyltransferase
MLGETMNLKWLVLPLALQPLWLSLPILAWAWVVGAVVGSFLNVVIYRMPVPGLSVVKPRSRCPQCETEIPWYDNVPVLSFLWLKGACRVCHIKISWRYPIIEACVGILFSCLVWRFGFSVQGMELFCLFCILLCVAMIDLDTWLIPNVFSLGLVPLGFIFSFLQPDRGFSVLPMLDLPALFINRAVGALIGLLLLGSLLVVSTFIFRKMGRLGENEFAMGWGDPFLLCGIGAFVGWQSLPVVIFLASIQGTIIGYWLIKSQQLSHSPQPGDDWVPPQTGVPFGPFLALGAIEAVLFFDEGGLGLFRSLIEGLSAS